MKIFCFIFPNSKSVFRDSIFVCFSSLNNFLWCLNLDAPCDPKKIGSSFTEKYFILENIFLVELLCLSIFSLFSMRKTWKFRLFVSLRDVTNDFYWISRLSPFRIARISFQNLSASLMHKLQTVSLRRCIEMRFFLINVSKHWLWTKQIRKTTQCWGEGALSVLFGWKLALITFY